MYKVIFTGGRNWTNSTKVVKEIKKLAKKHSNLLIITGGADGLDYLAEIWSRELNVHCAVIHALWKYRKHSAGPQRNKIMLNLEPDEVIAFHHDIAKSKGTKNMVEIARKANVPVKIIK